MQCKKYTNIKSVCIKIKEIVVVQFLEYNRHSTYGKYTYYSRASNEHVYTQCYKRENILISI